MKIPYIIHVKNREPELITIKLEDLEGCEHGLLPIELLLSQLTTSTDESQLAGVTCLCPHYQIELVERMSQLLRHTEAMQDARTLLKFIPLLDANDNPMAKEWNNVQHIVMGFVAAQKHYQSFLDAIENHPSQEGLTNS